MQRIEVTQHQRKAVMCNNSSKDKGLNLPRENVLWDDSQKSL